MVNPILLTMSPAEVLVDREVALTCNLQFE
jgi:hypothetical protein